MVTRSGLPQNYTMNVGNLLDDFVSSTWGNAVNGGTKTADTTNFKTGSESTKLTITTPGSWVSITKTLSLASSELYEIWVYLHNLTNVGFVFYMSSYSDFSKTFFFQPGTETPHNLGWNRIVFARSEMTNSGGDSWENNVQYMKIKLQAGTGASPAVSFDNLRGNVECRPQCVISFDDGLENQMTYIYPEMVSRGIPGTAYIISSHIGDAAFLTLANLQTMYAAGWAISNHTYGTEGGSNHVDLTTLSEADARSQISACRDWLIAQGFTRSANHFSWPLGGRNAALDAIAVEEGCLTSRLATTTYKRVHCPPYSLGLLSPLPFSTDLTLAQAKAAVDAAIANKSTLFVYGHVMSPGAANLGGTENFALFLDYLLEKKIACLTIDEWYEGITNPRYRSIPVSRA